MFGWLLVIAGGIFTAIGLIDFFSSFSAFPNGGSPTKFWCAFVGLPLLGLGLMLLKLGYMGTFMRYVAGETVPVATDAVNEMAHGTQEGVATVAAAVRRGLTENPTVIACPECDADNAPEASFCDQCGATMPRETLCPACHDPVEAGARFCDQCGHRLQH